MFIQRHRVAAAGVIAAAVIAVPAAALAAGTGSPAAKPSPTSGTASGQPASKPAPPATQPGPVSSQEAAARASKSAAAAAAASQQGPNGLAAVNALAARLHVSTDAAGPAFKEITALIGQAGHLDPASAAFAAIARSLGVSTAQLSAAWDAIS
jgi:hypothetical protein